MKELQDKNTKCLELDAVQHFLTTEEKINYETIDQTTLFQILINIILSLSKHIYNGDAFTLAYYDCKKKPDEININDQDYEELIKNIFLKINKRRRKNSFMP